MNDLDINSRNRKIEIKKKKIKKKNKSDNFSIVNWNLPKICRCISAWESIFVALGIQKFSSTISTNEASTATTAA